ncbi:matrixin family metalloprotease [uncultured Algimonas sp.]|uniref:matrixin family metalloprotease n=1 Tax=uncultured Algimonas sp. TaxID=1547920 RepID=UPI0026373BE1|nr:matrixin family metalloprotease [uncultured Algimonas sp.]
MPAARYRVGVMRAQLGEGDPQGFTELVDGALKRFSRDIADQLPDLSVETSTFSTPHLVPEGGGYNALDFVQLGLGEKAERGLSFLIIVTDVDLSPSKTSYTLALPSRITNIALVTTRRLNPDFWGETRDTDRARERLSTVLIHAFGHLLNLNHSDEPNNVMAPIKGVETLDRMTEFTSEQLSEIRETLPREAFDQSTRSSKFGFAAATIGRRLPSILHAVWRANPIKLVGRMPTMLATAFSVIALLLFGAEIWDYAAMASTAQVTGLTLISFAIGTFVLYRAFSFAPVSARDGRTMESTIVTSAATLITLFLTLLVMFALFAGLMFFFAATIFPEPLMESWPTVEDASSLGDHLRLSAFLAGLGVLSGSLGGSADSRSVVRRVLFMSDEI